MKATSVTVARLKANPSNRFENTRIEITVALDEGETAEQGVAAAQAFLARQFGEGPDAEEVEAAKAVLASAANAENFKL